MISAISHATAVQPAVQVKPAPQQVTTQPAVPSKSQSAASDTVQISNAAQQILKEAIETSAQTAHEAAAGDAQARRLLAKEAADNISVK
jgi:hypothetical protein